MALIHPVKQNLAPLRDAAILRLPCRLSVIKVLSMASRDEVLETLLTRRNAVRDIAAACGISTAAVSQWSRVPIRHLGAVADLVGMEQSELRPDLLDKEGAA